MRQLFRLRKTRRGWECALGLILAVAPAYGASHIAIVDKVVVTAEGSRREVRLPVKETVILLDATPIEPENRTVETLIAEESLPPMPLHAFAQGGMGPGPGTPAASGGGGVTTYLGYGCNNTLTNTCTVGGSFQFSISPYAVGYPITTGSDSLGYTVAAGAAYLDTVSGAVNLQIDIRLGPTTASTDVCHSSASTLTTVNIAWQENAHFSGCTLLASTTYYVFIQVDNNSAGIAEDATSAGYYFTNTFGSFPSGATTLSGADTYSVYARVTAN